MSWIWILLILTVSCQRYSQWQCHHINEKTSDITRIYYHSKDSVHGIDLEIIHTNGEWITYLQVHSQPLLPSYDDPEQTEIMISTADKAQTYLAPYHKGNQRIRLPNSLQTELISLLNIGNPVTLELKGYQEKIDPSHFKKLFRHINKKAPSILKKIHLYYTQTTSKVGWVYT